MARLTWAIACQRILLDQQTNMMSYIDALDGISLPVFPIMAPPIFVGTLWEREGEAQIEVQVKAYAPDGAILGTAVSEPLRFRPEHQRGRVNVVLAGIVLPAAGRYEFGIEIRDKKKWVEVNRIPFQVEQAVPGAQGKLLV
ncbi:MAG: hypothetical protein P4L36_20580 [Holophaga sp.]|nr:hypothetical protein [Holophaga sp.]